MGRKGAWLVDADDIKKLERHLVVPMLEGIEAMGDRFDKGLGALGAGIDGVRADIGTLGTKIDKLVEGQEKLVKGLTLTNERIEQVVVNTGTHWRDLERRVAVLEATVRKNGNS